MKMAKHQVQETKQQTATQLEELQEKGDMCYLCHKNPVNVILLECCHWILCFDCSHNLKKCPKCGENVELAVRTYMR